MKDTSLAVKGALALRLKHLTAWNTFPPASMRKGRDGGRKRGRRREYQPSGEGGTRLPPATPHRLQNPKWPPGCPKMAEGSGKMSTPRFLGVLSNFRQISFLIRALLLWEKVATEETGKKNGKNGEKKGEKKKKENTDENSGHYVIASSRPPERRPLERRTLSPIHIMS